MKKIYLTALLIISGLGLFAQPLPPDYPHGTATDVVAGAPIDGGLVILVIIGAVFGVKKVYSLKKKSLKEE